MTARSVQVFHRWTSIVFAVATVINAIAATRQAQSFWIGLLAFVPLMALMITGLYMFFQPAVSKWRAARGRSPSMR